MESNTKKEYLRFIEEYRYSLNPEYRKIYDTFKITKKMMEDRNCYRFITFPESIAYEEITIKSILRLLNEKKINAIMTTASAIDIDLLRAFGICKFRNTPNPLDIPKQHGTSRSDDILYYSSLPMPY